MVAIDYCSVLVGWAGPAVVTLLPASTTHSSLLPWWRGRTVIGWEGCCASVWWKGDVTWCASSATRSWDSGLWASSVLVTWGTKFPDLLKEVPLPFR